MNHPLTGPDLSPLTATPPTLQPALPLMPATPAGGPAQICPRVWGACSTPPRQRRLLEDLGALFPDLECPEVSLPVALALLALHVSSKAHHAADADAWLCHDCLACRCRQCQPLLPAARCQAVLPVYHMQASLFLQVAVKSRPFRQERALCKR